MTKFRPQAPDATYRKLIQDLLKRTRAKEVNWKTSGYGAGYEVIFPRSRVVLSFQSPEADPDSYTLELQNPDGIPVGAWVTYEPNDGQYRAESSDWQFANDLFAEARRTVLGWDAVLSDVEAALKQPGSIGLTRQRYTAPTDGDEDIPF